MGKVPSATPHHVAEILLKRLGMELDSLTLLQTLWAGYGQVCAIRAISKVTGASQSLILKMVAPPSEEGEEGHLRKMLSYQVEQSFYEHVAPRLDSKATPTATCLAAIGPATMHRMPENVNFGDTMAMVLTDLRTGYPSAGGKRAFLTSTQAMSALRWLARFHSQTRGMIPRPLDVESFVYPPLEEQLRHEEGTVVGPQLWLNGGYTYLATRKTELASLAQDIGSEWSAVYCQGSPCLAEMTARVLEPCGREQESYLHGDVKSENLFSTLEGDQVAFFDFQYVGLGLGVCDLAKLFTCSMPLDMLTSFTSADMPSHLKMESGERELLQAYHSTLHESSHNILYDWSQLVRHWETALVDWCRFQASWGFWGNTQWLQARVRSVLADQGWSSWLQEQIEPCVG